MVHDRMKSIGRVSLPHPFPSPFPSAYFYLFLPCQIPRQSLINPPPVAAKSYVTQILMTYSSCSRDYEVEIEIFSVVRLPRVDFLF